MRNIITSNLLLFLFFQQTFSQTLHLEESGFLTHHAMDTVVEEEFESATPDQTNFPEFSVDVQDANDAVIGGGRWGTNPFSGSKQFQIKADPADTITITFDLVHHASGFAIYLGDLHDANNDFIDTEVKLYMGDPASGTLIWHSIENFQFDTGTATNTAPFAGDQLVGNGENAFIGFSSLTLFNKVTLQLIDPHGQQAEHITFDDVFVAEPVIILSNEVLAFSGETEGNRIKLEWSLSEGRNAAYFLLEKSSDGIFHNDFEYITAYTNTKKGYDYIDEDVKDYPQYFYRLIAVDESGNHSESEIITVKAPELGLFNASLYPNPVQGVVYIEGLHSGVNTIQIVDQTGKSVASIEVHNKFQVDLDVSSLSAGLFYIHFLGEDGVHTRSFLKY